MRLKLIKSPAAPVTSREDGAPAAESLLGEIAALRCALGIAQESLLDQGAEAEPADIARLGGVIARLSDAIVRATLAQPKLSATGDQIAELQFEVKRIFRAMGWGEDS
jgi:uncharacterized membrane protein